MTTPCAVVILTCIAAAVFGSGSEYDVCKTRSLKASFTFGGRDVFCSPTAIRRDTAGRIYILDSLNHRIVVCNEQGEVIDHLGMIGSGPGEFLEPMDLDIGPSSRLYVADTGNNRIQILDSCGAPICIIPVGHPIRALSVAPDSTLYAVSSPSIGRHLIDVYDDGGNRLGSFGSFLIDQWRRPYISDALNRASVNVSPSGEILVGRWTIPQIARYDSCGNLLSSISVRGPEVHDNRHWFFSMAQNRICADDRLQITDPTVQDFINDVIAACCDGQPHGVIQLADVDSYGGRIYGLVRGVLYEYDSSGSFLHRYALLRDTGEPALIHRIWIDTDGTLFGLDMMHTYRCYIYHIPA